MRKPRQTGLAISLSTVFACLLFLLTPLHSQTTATSPEQIVIDASAPGHPFPHFWEKMFGSGRAVLSLREDYRNDLREVRQITGFEYVRFHAVFHDEMGVYDEDAQGHAIYNFSYVDQAYDGLLANGVRPFVELSFMPRKLAAREILHPFWYKQIVSPPKDYAKWDDLIAQFSRHLIERYGIEEVSQWYFEVWNEPNIDFWGGEPKQETYWELYDHTARALKGVSQRLRVGGPSTAQAAWADDFIQHCAEKKIPVDFVSSHVYGNDQAQDVFKTNEDIPRDQMVCRAVKKVHDQIKASAMPNLPLFWTEFNASYKNEPEVTDSIYMGPWMADTIRQCDGLVDIMSYWTFSDVFEEQGIVKTPFYGGFGLIAADSIPKPAFSAFRLLHGLGPERLAADSSSILVTRHPDGSLVLAVWNLAGPEASPAPRTSVATKSVRLHFEHLKGKRRAYISRVDQDHGNVLAAYQKMGRPQYPTSEEIQLLRKASELAPPESLKLRNGDLTVELSTNALAIIEVR